MYIGLHARHPLSCQILINIGFSRQIKKMPMYQIKWKYFQWESSIRSGRTDMTKLMVAFRNFGDAHKDYKFRDFLLVHRPLCPYNESTPRWSSSVVPAVPLSDSQHCTRNPTFGVKYPGSADYTV
jgi:hypothetical protein